MLPAALRKVPGEFTVELLNSTEATPLSKSPPKPAVTLESDQVPAPRMVPAVWLKAPPLKEKLPPLPMVMLPVFVNEGLVPDWETTSPPVTEMAPLLVWAADGLPSEKRFDCTSRRPRLSSCAVRANVSRRPGPGWLPPPRWSRCRC